MKKIRTKLIWGSAGCLVLLTIWLIWSNSSWLSTRRKEKPSKIAPYTLFHQASSKQASSNLDKEIAVYRKRTRQNPDGFLDFISLAQAYLSRAKSSNDASWYLLAEQAAQRSLANFQQNPGALLVLAQVAIARHDFQNALLLNQKAESYKPQNLGVQSNYVTLYLALGQVTQAAQAADILVARSPGLYAYMQRGLVKFNQGLESKAIADFKNAISREQAGQMAGSVQARAWLGRIYAQRGHPEWAEDVYREALRIQPRNALVLGLQADLKMRQRRFKSAGEDYANAYLKSQLPIYLLGQARARQARGQTSAAEAIWSQAEKLLRKELTSDSFGHRRDLARLILERNKPAQMHEALDLMQAEVRIRQDAITLNLLAWSLGATGNWLEAEKVIKQALASGILNAELLYRAGQIALNLDKPDEARDYFKLADQLDLNFRSDPAFTPFKQTISHYKQSKGAK